jgi:hypothetical protein
MSSCPLGPVKLASDPPLRDAGALLPSPSSLGSWGTHCLIVFSAPAQDSSWVNMTVAAASWRGDGLNTE